MTIYIPLSISFLAVVQTIVLVGLLLAWGSLMLLVLRAPDRELPLLGRCAFVGVLLALGAALLYGLHHEGAFSTLFP